jgi:hypothetical protein
MRQGSTVARAAIAIGVTLAGLPPLGRCGEPFDDRLGIRTVPLYLLMRADVQADLKLDPNQVSDSNRAAAVLHAKALGLKGKVGAGIVAARRAVDESQSQWLSAHLTPQQLERLGQIDLQWEGAAAMLNRPVVAEYLSLTPQQRARLAQLIADGRRQRPQIPWTPEEHTNLTRQAISVLSDRQKEQWIQVLGPPCRFLITAPSPEAADPTAGKRRSPGQSGTGG